MLTGYIRGQELRISTPEIAADSIKYLEAEFHFAGRDWDGYVKTAYFINGASKFALVLADDRITADMGLNLTAGEWEVKLSGVKGDSRITTTTERIYVREFGGTEGTLPDVTPTQAEQLLAKIGDMSALETEAKDSLVAAINEAAKSGGGGSGGKDGTGIESITYKGKDEAGGNMYTVLLTDGTSYDITAPKGAKGDKGDAGGKGDTGKAATIQVGEVTTGAAGTPASVSNVGTDESAIFDFTIPRGDKGADGADGADGVTPHIGDNGNWYLGETDTGKPSRGETGLQGSQGEKGDPGAKGKDGADGKSAYQYAQDGGYTGTETDFATKLAQGILSGTTADLTPAQVYAAVSAGRPVKVQYTSSSYGVMSFTAFSISETLDVIASQNIVSYNNEYMLVELGGYIKLGGWVFNSTTLAEKKDIPTIPTALPNPNALTVKIGSTTVTYDGSSAQTVEIADGTEVSY